jgi:hypothetical protein
MTTDDFISLYEIHQAADRYLKIPVYLVFELIACGINHELLVEIFGNQVLFLLSWLHVNVDF